MATGAPGTGAISKGDVCIFSKIVMTEMRARWIHATPTWDAFTHRSPATTETCAPMTSAIPSKDATTWLFPDATLAIPKFATITMFALKIHAIPQLEAASTLP